MTGVDHEATTTVVARKFEEQTKAVIDQSESLIAACL